VARQKKGNRRELRRETTSMRPKHVLLLVTILLAASSVFAASFQIITREGFLRKDRRFFAPVVARVPYGEILQELERRGDWLLVTYQGQSGWIHISAVQEKTFKLSDLAGGKAQEATREEVALAGKGFTPEVERAFQDKNPRMRYDLVDHIQRYRIEDLQVEAFIQEGNLREPGGAP
jgi:hypothetical protein